MCCPSTDGQHVLSGLVHHIADEAGIGLNLQYLDSLAAV